MPTDQGTAIENRIETVDILVFGTMNSTDDAKGFKYYQPAWRAKEQYKSTLKIEDNVTLWFLLTAGN
ncbi:MAG: hypothetical protein LUH15_18850 [Tannerellaceae bacterium]|nr:hypothetical protein [Tannerellaceae bacterium]